MASVQYGIFDLWFELFINTGIILGFRGCAPMAHSQNLCAPFSRDVRHMFTESVYYTCAGYMHQITTDFTSLSCLSIKY